MIQDMCHEAKTQEMSWCKQEFMGIGTAQLTKKAVFAAFHAAAQFI
ncbi:hypothetical protein L6R29_01870 [Myxococcota bacterium]|nr:hypothetical protein [Myxococcota bacterium]